MIRSIRGSLYPEMDGSVTVETESGVGLRVFVPANSEIYKRVEGSEVKLYTSMMVREDAMSLYGFSNKDERRLFELLITVNGVGAKAGMSIMSTLSPTELKLAIAAGDAKAISAANGIGKKTAERIILELKDKVEMPTSLPEMEGVVAATYSDERNEAVNALIALGYSKNEAASAIGSVAENGLTCEEYIKKALKNLF
ncbi:MAG: Holliday junction branch migration protein RuvA [Clostridia bacterium]|nr:Holliday junction branch migration protein RuvA [Clostridia bacterium]MDO5302683.1 Holliday junction branch migration protein RuvA [Clostridia bacterium]